MFIPFLFKLFKRRFTPGELLQHEKGNISSVSIDALRRGAYRQWRRIHDPEFQTQELIEQINRIVPPQKPGSN